LAGRHPEEPHAQCELICYSGGLTRLKTVQRNGSQSSSRCRVKWLVSLIIDQPQAIDQFLGATLLGALRIGLDARWLNPPLTAIITEFDLMIANSRCKFRDDFWNFRVNAEASEFKEDLVSGQSVRFPLVRIPLGDHFPAAPAETAG